MQQRADLATCTHTSLWSLYCSDSRDEDAHFFLSGSRILRDSTLTQYVLIFEDVVESTFGVYPDDATP
jgi:hypothetical protein